METKITFNQLVEKLSKITGCSNSTSELFIRDLFQLVTNQLIENKKITIKNIGTFSLIEDENVINYKPSKDIADTINLPFSCFEAIEIVQDITDDVLAEVVPQNEIEESKSENVEDVIVSNIETENLATKENTDSDNYELENPVVENKIEEPPISIVIQEKKSIETNIDDCEKILEKETYQKNKKSLSYIIIALIIGIAIGYYLGNIYPMVIPAEFNSDELVQDTIIDTTNILEQDIISRDSIILEGISDINIVKDTISTKRFLTTMARKHYGEMYFWVYIYEENKNILGNPNHIKPGTVVIIPSATKYGFDKDDIESVEKAKIKAMEIYSIYQ